MTENPDRIERTLEVLLYAPIGVGLFLKDNAPTFMNMFVSRGRVEVDQRVTTARSLGQVAMAFGPPVIRQRVEQTVTEACNRVGEMFGSPAPDAPAAQAPAETAAVIPEPAPWTPSTTTTTPAPAPVAPVVAATHVSAEAPETPAPAAITADPHTNGDASRSAALPIPGYDALSASQVVERLIGLAPDELDAVHEYESSHRQRRTILGKIEQLAG